MYFKNEVTAEGFLTDKPVLKQNKNGKNFCLFSVCYNESYKVNDEWKSVPHFFRCTSWSKEAEKNANLEKGQAVSVLGKLVNNNWTDESGKQHSFTSILAFHTRKLDMDKKDTQEEVVTPFEDIPEQSEIPFDQGLF